MGKYLKQIIILLCISLCQGKLYARSWDDLDEGEHDYYGSEKDEKMPVNAFFVEKEEWQNHSSLMALWLFRNTDYPRYTSLRVLPLYYDRISKIDNRAQYFLPLFLTYWHRDGNERLLATPLYFSASHTSTYIRSISYIYWWARDGETSSMQACPIFYHSNENHVSNQKLKNGYSRNENTWLTPLFYSSVYNDSRGGRKLRNLSPLHYFHSESDGNPVRDEMTWGFPLVPLIYSHAGPAEGHRNLFWLYDRAWSRNGDESRTTRLWILPFFLLGRSAGSFERGTENPEEGYLHILPPLFMSWKGEGSRTVSILGVTVSGGKEGGSFILPPVIFHESGEGGYRYYLPFYCRPADWTEEEGVSFSPMHYHSWSTAENVLWFLPWYSRTDKNGPDHLTMFFPVYTSWHSGDRDGRLILPLYFRYKSPNRSLYVNGLGLSRSISTGAMTPSLSVGGELSGRYWYLDTEVSWLYDMVSVGNRFPVKLPGVRDTVDPLALEEKAVPAQELSDRPYLASDETDWRTGSRYYYSVKLLYGWLAWEAADSRRHFRLLPLSWLTWDKTTSDRLYVLPPLFVWYNGEAERLSYLVIFPLYGSQRREDSYIRAWGLNLLWQEYDSSEKRHEYTVLWPFLNIYDSPSRGGWRMLPVIWHNWKKDDDTLAVRNISPVHYDSTVMKNGALLSRKIINPFIWYSRTNTFYPAPFPDRSEYRDTDILAFSPAAPLLIHRESLTRKLEKNISHESRTSRWISPLFYTSVSTSGSAEYENSENVKVETKDRLIMLPVIPVFGLGTSNWLSEKNDSSRMTEWGEIYTWLFPVLLYADKGLIDGNRNIFGSSNLLFAAGYYRYRDYSYTTAGFFPIVDFDWYNDTLSEAGLVLDYISFRRNKNYSQFMIGYDLLPQFRCRVYASGNRELSFLWPLFSFDKFGDSYEHNVFPLYYWRKDNDSWSFLTPALLSYFEREGDDAFDLALLGLCYYRNREIMDKSDRLMILLGILWNENRTAERGYHSRGMIWNLLWSHETEEETDFSKFSILKGLYKQVHRDGRTRRSIFWFIPLGTSLD